MRFWDRSALVPLLVPEAMSRSMQELYERDPIMIAWWATEIECTSAIARRQRLGQLPETTAIEAFGRLSALKTAWHEVEPGELSTKESPLNWGLPSRKLNDVWDYRPTVGGWRCGGTTL